jgi:large subunit ribosomal protein L35
MPKQKTHRASAKRFSFTKTGKVKRACAYKSHILTKKTTKRTRKLRKVAYASDVNARIIRKLVPYK